MPHAPALASCDRGGRIAPRRLALRGRRGDPSEQPWARSAELGGFALALEVEAGERAARIGVEVHNAGGEPRWLGSLLLGFEWQAPARGALRVFRPGAPGEPAGAAPLPTGPLSSRSPVVVGANGGGCALLGAHETGSSLALAQARPAEGGARLELELAVDETLAPGERRRLDPVEVAVGADPAALLEDFAARWGRAAGARTWRPAPLVWTAGEASAAGVLRALGALAAGGDALPFEVLRLAPDSAAPGDAMRAGPGYPDGFAPVVAAIRAAGLVPGLRIAPLDLADPAARCARLRELGFHYLELDGFASEEASAAALRRARRACEAARSGAGEEVFLLARGAPPGAAVGAADALEAAGPEPAHEARRLCWLHRRLALLAAASRDAAECGAALRAGADALQGSGVARWRAAARAAAEVDRLGLPGVARAEGLLGPEPRLRSEKPAAAPRLVVFCDFDGTFSVQDVGATLAARHGGPRRPQVWARYERGEITPWDYNLEILDGLPVGAEALAEFLAGVDLDPGAPELLAWCAARRVPFRILSDGFDWNLNRLQWQHGVRFAYTANHLRVEDGRWRIAAGAPDPDCGCGTGTCKAAALRATRALHPGAHLVHIGNGRVSDSCGAVEADTAFAKDSLAESLTRRGEPFVAFETLRDVLPHLERILGSSPST